MFEKSMDILTYGEDEEPGYVLHQRTGRGRQAGRVGDGGTPPSCALFTSGETEGTRGRGRGEGRGDLPCRPLRTP